MIEKFKNLKQKLGKWFWVILVIILIIVWRVLVGVNKSTKVETIKVARGSLVQSVSTSGTVRADQYSQLTFPSGGKIEAVFVKSGQTVKKGAWIAQLDMVSLSAAYQQAANNYRNYQAIAEQALDSVKGHSADETFAQKVTRTTAEVERDNAYNAVLAAQNNLTNARIVAPFAGIIDTALPSSPGMQVLAGAANYTIVNPDTVYFDAEVEETDLPNVAVGQKVNIKLDAYPDDIYQGVITSVGVVAFTSATGGNAYHVRISLPENTDMKFKVGMGGDSDIIYNTIEDVLKIPVSAIVTDTNNYIWEVKAGRAKKVTIETGGENNDEAEVKSGVKEGTVIVSQPPTTLKDGVRVQI
jgi:RND family efflux transporter MFP subunit